MPTSDDQALRSLARDWWEIHRDGGALNSPTPSDEDELFTLMDWVNETDNRVDELGADPGTLPVILRYLVEEIPPGEDVSFIGTWVIENSEMAIGSRAVQAVRESDLPREMVAELLSGVASVRWKRDAQP